MANYDLIVIGEGIAGLTCANHAARAGLKVATFEGNMFGGLVLNVNELEGFPEDRQTSGAEFASELMEANSGLHVDSVQEPVTAVKAAGDGFELQTGGGRHAARQVVAASGARLKKLGVPGETEYEGRGVSQCADCDGPMFQNEEVAVVGGGDAALQEALVLAKYCGKVHVLNRGGRLRARQHFVDLASAEPKISIVHNTVLDAILGGKMVEKIRVRGTQDGAAKEMPCAGVFVNIGLAPSSDFLPQDVKRDGQGAVVTGGDFESSLKGVWAIGAVRSGYSGLLRDAAGEAQSAARAIAARLGKA
jgi:thioredoxin reductase (NADPH)